MRPTGALASTLAFAFALASCDAAPPVRPAATAASTTVAAPALSTAAPADVAPAPAVEVGDELRDAIHEYTGGAQRGETLPLVIAIHGLGDRPESFQKLFEGFPARAHVVVPAGGLKWGDGFAWWPITGTIDEKNMAAGLDAAAARLHRGIQAWHDGQVAGKPIVTGFSQGGMLSFAVAVKYPRSIAEAVPVSGLLPPSMVPAVWPPGEPMPRIVALHGDADTRVPYAFGQKSVASLRALGLDAELKSYPGVGHTLTSEMRRDLFAALSAAIERAARAR